MIPYPNAEMHRKIVACTASLMASIQNAGGRIPVEELLDMKLRDFIADIAGPNDIKFIFYRFPKITDGDEIEGEDSR